MEMDSQTPPSSPSQFLSSQSTPDLLPSPLGEGRGARRDFDRDCCPVQQAVHTVVVPMQDLQQTVSQEENFSQLEEVVNGDCESEIVNAIRKKLRAIDSIVGAEMVSLNKLQKMSRALSVFSGIVNRMICADRMDAGCHSDTLVALRSAVRQDMLRTLKAAVLELADKTNQRMRKLDGPPRLPVTANSPIAPTGHQRNPIDDLEPEVDETPNVTSEKYVYDEACGILSSGRDLTGNESPDMFDSQATTGRTSIDDVIDEVIDSHSQLDDFRALANLSLPASGQQLPASSDTSGCQFAASATNEGDADYSQWRVLLLRDCDLLPVRDWPDHHLDDTFDQW